MQANFCNPIKIIIMITSLAVRVMRKFLVTFESWMLVGAWSEFTSVSI
jgi:hypothetical protein